ncbi:MAG: glycosyltransferase family 2 protein [Bacillota bacterium]
MPAHNEGDTVALTLRSLARLPGLRRLILVDDGSDDDTVQKARSMGAHVIRMTEQSGKGAAVRRGLDYLSDCPFVLLLDADLGDTSAQAWRLLRPVINGSADVTVARFSRQAAGSGFGIVKAVARTAVSILAGARVESVLSGQRALSQKALKSVSRFDDGYGLETGMIIDLLRHGMKVVEVDVDMKHKDYGRTLHGFCHRGRQLLDIAVAVASRACL